MPVPLNNPVDISSDFFDANNEYYVAARVKGFDKVNHEGSLQWDHHRWTSDWFFNKIERHLQKQTESFFPFQDYEHHPAYSFSFSFVTARTFRLRIKTSAVNQPDHESLMIEGPLPEDKSWKQAEEPNKIIYRSDYARIEMDLNPWQLRITDNEGVVLVETKRQDATSGMYSKMLPFQFLDRSTDGSRSIAASFSLSPGENIYGCGESFTALNKRGQKIVLSTTDAQSTSMGEMYKPIPFFFSSRGYGMFVHSSSPMTFDFGKRHAGCQTLFVGDNALDIFFFIGDPKEILSEYTAITGRSPLPPLWSFGLWMSRFSYRSQTEVENIAEKLRKNKIPCDVIHIDAGWFKKGINCDFEFCTEAFPDPKNMIRELDKKGFRVSLWQIPYFTPLNPIFSEVVEKKLYIRDGKGNLPTRDAILDMSNDETIKWYQSKLKTLFETGIAAIKADFGEAAPLHGYYYSGRSGFYEHNLYPLRYNKIVSEITLRLTGEHITWARSAWAGSQRYPVHWGGDAEVSDTGMACSLRGGLSLGLSGFSFWSHDIGGFSGSPTTELFKRWAFFGLLSSHSRVHGFPPREPWEFGEDFIKVFRTIVELKYKLLPYIYTQAANCSQNGWPMLKALFLNYPGDPTAWMIEDEYLLGDDILVAPMFEKEKTSRKVYLPAGKWINYFSNEIFEGEKWHSIHTNEIPGIVLIRSGSLIPHIALSQSTSSLDWSTIEVIAFTAGENYATGKLYLPGQHALKEITALYRNGEWRFDNNNKDFPIRPMHQSS